MCHLITFTVDYLPTNLKLSPQAGFPLDMQDDKGWTALHHAAQSGFCVDVLVKANASVNVEDNTGTYGTYGTYDGTRLNSSL